MAQNALHESENLNRGIIEASPDCVWLLDSSGEVLFVNKATVSAAGASDASALIGQRWGSGLAELPRARAEAAVAQAQAGEIARLVLKGGRWLDRWLDVVVAPIFDENGHPVRLVVISRDITEQKTAEERAQWAANHDPLTQLPNRFLLQQRLEAEIEHCEAVSGGFALMMLDVDHLKRVNDGLGHDAGDALLMEIAGRLKSVIRDGDTVARLGGDEFAVILAGTQAAADAQAVAATITAKLAEPFLLWRAHAGLPCQHRRQPVPRPGEEPGRADEECRRRALRCEVVGTGRAQDLRAGDARRSAEALVDAVAGQGRPEQ
jgi:diguanylate cyclase (GGDEF)-like protein/PAS domain S-box-containing protein